MTQWKTYSHVANLTGYMELVAQHFSEQPEGLRILDLPAGNGLLADALRGMGHIVVCGDINRDLLQQAFRAPVLLSRSLVLVLEKA